MSIEENEEAAGHHVLYRHWGKDGKDALRRAREWALRRRYYLLDSVPACAHAFYRMRCPNIISKCLPYADHTEIWVPAPDFSDFERHSGAPAPFILTQPYPRSLEADDNGIPPWRPGIHRVPASHRNAEPDVRLAGRVAGNRSRVASLMTGRRIGDTCG